MANIKLLQEAIQAYANGEQGVADKKMRKYFVEAAQEINKQLEEEMEDEMDCDEEVIEEDFNTAPDAGLNNEIQYVLDEEEKEDDAVDAEVDVDSEVESDVDSEADGFSDVDADVDAEVDAESDAPSGEEWASIKDAFAGLSQMFAELGVDGSEGDDEVEVDTDYDLDIDADGTETEDEFSDVDFGEEKFGEGYKMKPVSKPSNDAAKSKSPVAPNAKSPVDGVAPVKIKDGTVVTNDGDLLKNKDAETAKVEDMNNVMDNGKNLMKTAKTPKNTAEKSRSPLPKNAPKF